MVLTGQSNLCVDDRAVLCVLYSTALYCPVLTLTNRNLFRRPSEDLKKKKKKGQTEDAGNVQTNKSSNISKEDRIALSLLGS